MVSICHTNQSKLFLGPYTVHVPLRVPLRVLTSKKDTFASVLQDPDLVNLSMMC